MSQDPYEAPGSDEKLDQLEAIAFRWRQIKQSTEVVLGKVFQIVLPLIAFLWIFDISPVMQNILIGSSVLLVVVWLSSASRVAIIRRKQRHQSSQPDDWQIPM